MNAREGMRRVGLVAGTVGACFGFSILYSEGSSLWNYRSQHKLFEQLASTPTIQAELKAIHEAAATKPKEEEPPGWKPVVPKGYKLDGPWVYYSALAALSGSTDGWPVGKNGISTLYFQNSVLTGIEKSDGDKEYDVTPPPLGAYLVLIFLPILGFLIPWSLLKLLVWIGAGFFKT